MNFRDRNQFFASVAGEPLAEMPDGVLHSSRRDEVKRFIADPFAQRNKRPRAIYETLTEINDEIVIEPQRDDRNFVIMKINLS